MTVTDTSTSLGGGVGAVYGAAGLSVASGVDVGACPGPLLVGDVTDAAGGLIGVVAVTDTGDGADALVTQAVEAAAMELGGAGLVGTPVGSGAEIAARFAMPVTSVVWAGADGQPAAAFVTPSDRRGPEPAAVPMSGAAPMAGAAAGPGGTGGTGLDKLVNVSLEVSVELGRTKVTLADVLNYDVGATIELDRAAGAPVDIRVNETLLAQGEVVLIDDEYAVRITAIIDPNQVQ
jgi:flagellar motor switch protein FliN/FliY